MTDIDKLASIIRDNADRVVASNQQLNESIHRAIKQLAAVERAMNRCTDRGEDNKNGTETLDGKRINE